MYYTFIFLSPSGADPEFFLGGGALVSCSISTPINHIVCLFVCFFLQNTSCIRKPLVISGGVRTPAPSPRSAPGLFKQNIKSCSAKREGNVGERWKIAIGLISKNSNFARTARFFCTFFAVVLHHYNVKLPETLGYTFYGGNVVRVLVQLFFHCPLIFTLHWWLLAFPILSPSLQNFHVVLPTKKMSPLFFISRSRPLSPFFSLSFAGLPPTFSFSLSFSCSIFQSCCNKRKKKLVPYVVMEKKDNKRNAGDFKKKTELKKIPFTSLFILIDRCPSRPSTMTATATSRNVNYLPWRCTTTAWNVLISRSMEYLNVRQRCLFLFLNFDRALWNLTPKKELCQHLANWTRWNKGDIRNKVWNAAWMQFLRACGGVIYLEAVRWPVVLLARNQCSISYFLGS